MFSLSKSLLATVVAWFSAVSMIIAHSYVTRPASYWAANPIADFFSGVAFVGYFVGVVVIPTCLFLVTPLLCLLPSNSIMWRPSWACAVGLIVGPIAMYLWASGFRGRFFIPEPHDSTHLKLGICSALTGAIFAYSYSLAIARGLKAGVKLASNKTKEAEHAAPSNGG